MQDEDLRSYWSDVTVKPPLRVYEGHRTKTGKCVVTVSAGKKSAPLKLYKSVVNHSPTGFEWGYAGPTSAQLALAILMDVLGDKPRAIGWHQSFKRDVIASLPQDRWTLTAEQVLATVARLEGPGKGGDRGG